MWTPPSITASATRVAVPAVPAFGPLMVTSSSTVTFSL
jgi:hypothetical protein